MNAGKSLSLFFSAFTGQPSSSSHLRRLSEIGPARGIIGQRRYSYEDDREALTTMEMTPWKFSSFLRRITQKSHETRALLEMAVRWYSIGITAKDPLDAYLALWIGLEALSASLAKRYHPTGYDSCQLCKKASLEVSKVISRQRDIGDLLAINHLVARVAHELLAQRSIVDLKNLRNTVAHPDRPIREGKSLADVRAEIKPLVQDIQLCLGVAILNVVNPQSETPGAVPLWATPRVEPHPHSMVQLTSDFELNCFDPWSGKWINLERYESKISSGIDKDGFYSAQMESYIPIPRELSGTKANFNIEEFKFLRGREITDLGTSLPTHREWRPIKVSEAWKRMKAKES